MTQKSEGGSRNPEGPFGPQHEHLPPAGYVQAYQTITHGDDIADGVETIQIDGATYPAIVRALNLIREDSGGPSWPPEASPLVAARWSPYLARIEAAIADLSDNAPAPEDAEACARVIAEGFSYLDSELYTFCNGEHSAMMAIAAVSPDRRIASRFLNDFFEGWSGEEDEGFDPTPLAIGDRVEIRAEHSLNGCRGTIVETESDLPDLAGKSLVEIPGKIPPRWWVEVEAIRREQQS
jgi:hypothetical protein